MSGLNGREIRLAMLAALPIDGSAIKLRKALAKQPDSKMHGTRETVKVVDSGIGSLKVILRGIDKGLDKDQEV